MSDEARASEGTADPSFKRLSTGNRELDDILQGGIPENSINIIMGEPGSGKTTLAEEFMFANANDERRPILYLTTLSEPLDKVIKYLQQFRFFDVEKMGRTIRYEAFLFDNVLYQRKGRLWLWMTDDVSRLPVQIRVRLAFPIGNITLMLDKDEH